MQKTMCRQVRKECLIMANRINLNGTSYHGAGAIGEIATEAKGRGAALTGYASPNTIYTFFPLSYQMPSDLRTASTFFSASASALV